MKTPSFYEILGVSKYATIDEIHSAYHKLAQQFHPDKHASETNSTFYATEFRHIHEIYEILANHIQRAEYDQFLTSSESFEAASQANTSIHEESFKRSANQAEKHHNGTNAAPNTTNKIFNHKSRKAIFATLAIVAIIYFAILTRPHEHLPEKKLADTTLSMPTSSLSGNHNSTLEKSIQKKNQVNESNSFDSDEKTQDNTGEINF